MKLEDIKKMKKDKLKELVAPSEHTIQTNVVNWAKRNNVMVFSVPNEATRSNFNFKKSGVMAGVSDLIVVIEGEVLFIEVKTPKGRQSDKQKAFEKKVKDLNHVYEIVRSLEDFQTIIKNHYLE